MKKLQEECDAVTEPGLLCGSAFEEAEARHRNQTAEMGGQRREEGVPGGSRG